MVLGTYVRAPIHLALLKSVGATVLHEVDVIARVRSKASTDLIPVDDDDLMARGMVGVETLKASDSANEQNSRV